MIYLEQFAQISQPSENKAPEPTNHPGYHATIRSGGLEVTDAVSGAISFIPYDQMSDYAKKCLGDLRRSTIGVPSVSSRAYRSFLSVEECEISFDIPKALEAQDL